ncbi:MAG: hypothetical protein KIS91_05070 [Anaerolineae bacterium]|nr:hypothetical protein [Anaerolineae bacterium]
MLSRMLRTLAASIGLGLALALTLSLQSGEAVCGPGNASDYCSASHGLVGGINSVSGRTAKAGPGNPSVDGARIANAGALIHADYKKVEQQAFALADPHMKFRQSISPSKQRPDFDRLIRGFNYNLGYEMPVPCKRESPDIKLSDCLVKVDKDLAQARDLYAFLAAFADEARFRTDTGVGDDPRVNYDVVCPDTRTADDPVNEVYDRCYFAARMRQVVREAAYIHMILGQQFTVDALGLHFSANQIVGGEVFVRDEVKKLQMAMAEYDAAERIITDGLKRTLGNGCLVSDFYTQPEWGVLSRATEGKARAQYEIATRLSYLDVGGQSKAQATYQDASQDQYVQLVNTAALATKPLTNASCPRGEQPDGTALALMVISLLDTQARANELSDGRNIFGYNVEYTPARPYRTSFGSNDTGILNEAKEAAQLAKTLQNDEQQNSRYFDQQQQALTQALLRLTDGRDEKLQAETGCLRSGFETDELYFQCIDDMITNTTACDVEATPTTDGSDDAFDKCINKTRDNLPPDPLCNNCIILVSDMRQSRIELRQIYLQWYAAKQKANNIHERIKNEQWRAQMVSVTIGVSRVALSALEFADAMVDAMTDSGNALRGGLLGSINAGKTLVQMAEDIGVENINSQAEIKNAMLDLAEAVTEGLVAKAEYRAKATEFSGVVGQTGTDVEGARRERGYLQQSPANDPSFRLVRDSSRLQLASALQYAARVSYLAARRAEYEYAARLNASTVNGSPFRLSDIYRARTADDILLFLQKLEGVTNDLLQVDSDLRKEDLTVSVAVHILGLTDVALQGATHPNCPTGGDVVCVRRERFRDWVRQNTTTGAGGKPVLTFTFGSSIADGGLFSKVIPPDDYEHFWLHKLSGLGQPKPTNTGLGINLLTTEPGSLGYRRVLVSQTGLTEMRSRAGCIFPYRLVNPAALAGREWASNQLPEVVGDLVRAGINGANGESTAQFLGRPVAATRWAVEVRSGAPQFGLPDMDLQQLTDIQLQFSTTRAFRQAGIPTPSDCVRADF